jgi:hypothetical protein
METEVVESCDGDLSQRLRVAEMAGRIAALRHTERELAGELENKLGNWRLRLELNLGI